MTKHEHEELSETERLQEARLRELLDGVREDVRAPASLRAGVMSRIEEIPDPVWKRIGDWWLRPRTLRFTPAGGALAAAVLAALLLLPGRDRPLDEPNAAATAEAVTRFVLVAPGATSVHVTGDFVGWSPTGIELEDPRGTGVWTADVPLPPGVGQYTFVIDGTEWVPDPRAVSQVDDGFGQVNSVVIVPGGNQV